MSRSHFTQYIALLAVPLLLASVLSVVAQSGGQYDLSWNTVDGGGMTHLSAGAYALSSTAGQPDAGPALSGGDYALVGGFWSGVTAQYRVYLPLVLRNA
jgi:hypothetical protein